MSPKSIQQPLSLPLPAGIYLVRVGHTAIKGVVC